MSTAKMAGTDNIFLSCKKGNLERIKFLVESEEIDLNIRDRWDSTPLYYACHCGHVEVVKYLLGNGARCEENTFDGERCLYAALTDEIKMILLKSKAANFASRKLDDYDDFCKRMLEAEHFSDFTLRLRGGKIFKLHRCILAARSPGLKSLLARKWRNSSDVSNSIIDPTVFEAFIKYVYTGKLKFSRDDYNGMTGLLKRCGLSDLIPKLEYIKTQSKSIERSKQNIKVTTLLFDNKKTREVLEEEFCTILDKEMDDFFVRKAFLRVNYSDSDDNGDETEAERMSYFDIVFKIEGTLFFCHKVFVCTRSAYFDALLQDHFNEYRERCNGLPLVTLHDVTPLVFSVVLYYIYSNQPYNINEEIVLDVVEASDIFLLPGLTKICGDLLCKRFTLDNAMDRLLLARQYNLRKLESYCLEFIAEEFPGFYSNKKLRALILQDANEVKCREETDSITIIDDIRYRITRNDCFPWYADEQARDSLMVIKSILKELGLEA